jgi:hypothetical protein
MTTNTALKTIELAISLVLNDPEEKSFTLLHCSYFSKHYYVDGGWVNIWPTTYLIDTITGQQLELIHEINIPVAPNKFYFKKAGQLKNFTLIFPAIPKDWAYFDFIEKAADHSIGFRVNKLQRNDLGVYRLTIQ